MPSISFLKLINKVRGCKPPSPALGSLSGRTRRSDRSLGDRLRGILVENRATLAQNGPKSVRIGPRMELNHSQMAGNRHHATDETGRRHARVTEPTSSPPSLVTVVAGVL
ncbi:hypothetical protein Pan216_02560 [Planctomycetes bacterium Pan216]|uniref:Uncharacterized protein n=1 Tax=Kolteria novifilia TaxID=2527975 RepID=A0A518AXH4_9BACT|nr:hypothetical protein Pan216_02560 [Planctomycetes bacterium Pan216]